MNTSPITFNKHLTYENRKLIEKSLNDNLNFSQIGLLIGKPYKTISNEIKRNKIFERASLIKWCHQNPCYKFTKPPYVCNGCYSRRGCRRSKYFYFADDAHLKYQNKKRDSRIGINMTSSEFKHLNDIVSKEISNGHSFSMIIRNHKHEFPVGERTLYNYVENGYLDIINLDLPRKVTYKKRTKKQKAVPKDTKIRIGRTYSNFNDYVKHYNDNNFNIDIVEMDTVEGCKGDDENVLLTLLWRHSNFMLAFKLENKNSECVSNFFLELKELLGYEEFHTLFPILLTDNGPEFSNPNVIEYNGNHVYPTKLFYCDPGHSEQKGKIEVNHEYIRRFIPKGTSFNNYTQDNINLMLNHINSVKRKSLAGENPYTLMKDFLPSKLIDLFDIEEIEQENIILKKKII